MPARPAPPTATPATPQNAATSVEPPVIHAASAILIDAASGQVLYERNADAPRPMASTTKIMTALLFCENVPENVFITASKRAAETRESSLHLKEGEKVSAHDLLRAMLMRSANDACVAAAEHVSGSVEAFADLMNTRAAALGATHTHFTNPHGLNDPAHYTTARDLALIARAAMQEPRIAEVVRTKHCRITRSMNTEDVTLRNHSHFLGAFPGADGVKTGWTVPAGHCYVGSATWNGWRLISVVLKSPDYVHETAALMKYGFYHFEPHIVAHPGDTLEVPIHNAVKPEIAASVKSLVQVVTRKGEMPDITKQTDFLPLTAPVAVGTQVGTMNAVLDGKTLCSSPIIANEAALSPPSPRVLMLPHNSPWKSLLFASTIFAASLVSLRYGTRNGNRFAALAKSTRRRWRRLKARL